jgi:hypothetical protein
MHEYIHTYMARNVALSDEVVKELNRLKGEREVTVK